MTTTQTSNSPQPLPPRIDPMQDPNRPSYFIGTAADEHPAELALRRLAAWLGVGGFNAPTVDAKAFEDKIRVAVQDLQRGQAAEPEWQTSPGAPDDLRARGWMVAVHNDYRINGVGHTFWLVTKGDRCIKGEGLTDAAALTQIRAKLAQDAAEGAPTPEMLTEEEVARAIKFYEPHEDQYKAEAVQRAFIAKNAALALEQRA